MTAIWFLNVFAEYPAGCIHYRKFNSLDCYVNMWLGSGCLEDGRRNPATSPTDAATLDEMNLE